jgi:hypothetical protein
VTINQIFVDNQTYNTSLFLNVGQKRKVLLPYPFANGTDYRYRVSLNYTDSKTNARYYISKPELVIEGKGGRYALSNIPLYNSLAFYVRADANAVDLLGGLAASFGTNTSTGLSARRGSTFGATGGGAGAISYGLGTTTNTSFSMALFVNPNGCNGGGPLMAKRSFIFFDDNYGCRSANNGFQCRVGSSEVESFGSCSAGIWQHLALTYNSQNGLISVYVNGALINSTTEYGSFASNANPLRFNYDAGAGSGNSQYSDAYVFNRTLSAADINQLYSEVFTLN